MKEDDLQPPLEPRPPLVEEVGREVLARLLRREIPYRPLQVLCRPPSRLSFGLGRAIKSEMGGDARGRPVGGKSEGRRTRCTSSSL